MSRSGVFAIRVGYEGEGGTALREQSLTERQPDNSDVSSRVIQAQGKFRSRRLVKNWCKWVRKIEISQNLCVQLAPEQFSHLD